MRHKEGRILNGAGATKQTAGPKDRSSLGCVRRKRRNTHLVDHSCPLVLLQPRLHLRERVEDRLGLLDLLLVVPEELKGSLEDLSCLVEPPPLLFELSPFDPHTRLWADSDPSFVDGTRAIELLIPLLELDVCLPGLVVWLPLHPTLEDLTSTRDILEKFLEVDVLVPELVDAWEEGHGAVEKVAGVLDVAAFELDFSVREPELNAAWIDVEGSLEDRAGASVFALTGLLHGVRGLCRVKNCRESAPPSWHIAATLFCIEM